MAWPWASVPRVGAVTDHFCGGEELVVRVSACPSVSARVPPLCLLKIFPVNNSYRRLFRIQERIAFLAVLERLVLYRPVDHSPVGNSRAASRCALRRLARLQRKVTNGRYASHLARPAARTHRARRETLNHCYRRLRRRRATMELPPGDPPLAHVGAPLHAAEAKRRSLTQRRRLSPPLN